MTLWIILVVLCLAALLFVGLPMYRSTRRLTASAVFENLNLARESARSLIIAERDIERHESRLCEVTWEEVDRRLREAEAHGAVAAASALGVELAASR